MAFEQLMADSMAKKHKIDKKTTAKKPKAEEAATS
jgi:hypothetical protein